MRQQTLAEEGFEKYRKLTRREQFINEMDQLIPCAELSAVIERFYPRGKAGSGRRWGGAHAVHPIPAALVHPAGPGGGEMLYDWYFGMTAHIRVDSRNRLIRSPMARKLCPEDATASRTEGYS